MAKNRKATAKLQRLPRNSVKKHGKKVNLSELRSQLDLLGLKIIEVVADGNCFFRSLADQLEGNEEEHARYRAMVVQYIRNHREDFEPFIEDEVQFDDYCKSMEEDGTWAGHMELQAASLVTRTNICIHQLNSPRWYISNFATDEVNMIHLSYHHGEHYNSVRLREDPCEGPAKPIFIKLDANISRTSDSSKATTSDSKKSTQVKTVMDATRCYNTDKIQMVLREVAGDVDAAIEYIIAEKESADSICIEESSFSDTNEDVGSGSCSPSNSQRPNKENQLKDKKSARDKELQHGSAKQRRAAALVIKSKGGSRGKEKKGQKQNKIRDQLERAPAATTRSLPDMGALCI
ncbi:SEC-C motif-containing protein / OTU-like cysteine protease family protein isoform X1 [Carex rostrata]